MIWIIVYFIYSTEFIPVLNARTRLLLQDTAGAALKSRLRLSALTDKKIGSGIYSGHALKMAAPAPQHWEEESTRHRELSDV